MNERMAWSGQCNRCWALYTIVASDESTGEDQDWISDNWPTQGDCMVDECDGTVEWNGNDPVKAVLVRA